MGTALGSEVIGLPEDRLQSAHDAELCLIMHIAAEPGNGTEEDFVPIE